MIEKKTWEEFKNTLLFKVINRFISVFHWVIIIENKRNNTYDVYPAKIIKNKE